MGSRVTIYMPESARTALDMGEHDSMSGRIVAIIGRYRAMVAESIPEYTREEWLAICDANNGTALDFEGTPVESARWMWANVADSEGIGEKWGIDAAALIRKMRGASAAQSAATMEIVRRFWARANQETDEALSEALKLA